MRRAGPVVCALLCAAACSADSARPTAPLVPPASPGPVNAGPPPPPPRALGLGHTGAIDLVAMTAAGDAALTRDQFGATRLWPRLDGSAEPQPVPLRGAQHLSLAAAPGGGSILAGIDAAGGGQVLRATGAGAITPLFALPPYEPLLALEVLPGGEQVVALGKDHVLRVVDLTGRELARHEQRELRASRLVVAGGGALLIAVTLGAPQNGAVDGEAQVIQLAGSPQTLTSAGAPIPFKTLLGPTLPVLAVAPGGRRLAGVQRSTTASPQVWQVVITDLGGGPERKLEVPIPTHLDVSLGFLDDDRLLATSARGGATWLIDLRDEASVYPLAGPPPVFNNLSPADHAASRRAVGVGQWLYVQDLAGNRSTAEVYLGYELLRPSMAALSPSGTAAAWLVSTGLLYVEKAGRLRLAGWHEQWMPVPTQARFLDEEHLVVTDMAGGLRLIHWPTDRVLATTSTGGPASLLEVDPGRRLVAVRRPQNDSWIFEVSPRGELTGPYVLIDGSARAGLLFGAGDDTPALWTLDAALKWRAYTVAELRAGVSKAMAAAKVPPEQPALTPFLAVDRTGRRYLFKMDGGKAQLQLDEPAGPRTTALLKADVAQLVPAPDGSRVLVLYSSGLVGCYRTGTLELAWSFATGTGPFAATWSHDGSTVAIAGGGGGALLDAATGTARERHCSAAFELRRSPPLIIAAEAPTLCEP